ncbi:MAG: hypothetical protein U5R14_10520 [Gemmatimonadota bacterium]|nr:hypothetical protein [Gemmatimonadota bacterium]
MQALNVQVFLEILKDYGPVVGILLGFIWWQSRWISKLLDRHEKAYVGEIERMSKVHDKLLAHVLGEQPSSTAVPAIDQLRASSKPRNGSEDDTN